MNQLLCNSLHCVRILLFQSGAGNDVFHLPCLDLLISFMNSVEFLSSVRNVLVKEACSYMFVWRSAGTSIRWEIS